MYKVEPISYGWMKLQHFMRCLHGDGKIKILEKEVEKNWVFTNIVIFCKHSVFLNSQLCLIKIIIILTPPKNVMCLDSLLDIAEKKLNILNNCAQLKQFRLNDLAQSVSFNTSESVSDIFTSILINISLPNYTQTKSYVTRRI